MLAFVDREYRLPLNCLCYATAYAGLYTSTGHDDINLERNQFGRKSGVPLELPLGISVFNDDVAALDVA